MTLGLEVRVGMVRQEPEHRQEGDVQDRRQGNERERPQLPKLLADQVANRLGGAIAKPSCQSFRHEVRTGHKKIAAGDSSGYLKARQFSRREPERQAGVTESEDEKNCDGFGG